MKVINTIQNYANKTRLIFFLYFLPLLMFMVFSCNKEQSLSSVMPIDSSAIVIIDRYEVEWDVTNAVNTYGWDPKSFRFGLGMNSIPAIRDPQFFQPGDGGYPISEDTFMVLGIEIEGDARAYPIYILKSREVVNDKFSERYVALAY